MDIKKLIVKNMLCFMINKSSKKKKYCKLVEGLNTCLSLQLLPFILFSQTHAKLGMACRFTACLLNYNYIQ